MPRGPQRRGATARADVQIVGPLDGWILERLARKLAAKLPYARFVPWRPEPGAALAYYVNYALFERPAAEVDVGFFTHAESGPDFVERARHLDAAICMARQYADFLREQYVLNVHHVPMGCATLQLAPRLVVGVVGKLEHPRKGLALVQRIRELPFVEVRATGGRLAAADIREFYQALDAVLIPATVEGGPMAFLEGVAAGKPIVAPAGVGVVPEFEPSAMVRLYPPGDFPALREVLEELFAKKRKAADLVRDRSWDAWAAAHHDVFRCLLATRGIALPEGADQHRYGLASELAHELGELSEETEHAIDVAAAAVFHGRLDDARRALLELGRSSPAVAELAAKQLRLEH